MKAKWWNKCSCYMMMYNSVSQILIACKWPENFIKMHVLIQLVWGVTRNSPFLAAPMGDLRILVSVPPYEQEKDWETTSHILFKRYNSCFPSSISIPLGIWCFYLYYFFFILFYLTSLVGLLLFTFSEDATKHFGNCHCRSNFFSNSELL